MIPTPLWLQESPRIWNRIFGNRTKPINVASKARRTLSISALRNYVYKHVYIYFLAVGQARAVGSLESGNLVVYGPLKKILSLI